MTKKIAGTHPQTNTPDPAAAPRVRTRSTTTPALRQFFDALSGAISAIKGWTLRIAAVEFGNFSTVRVTGLVAVALGSLSIMNVWIKLDEPAIRVFLIPLDDALGLVFLGFAVRMSRLEDFRPTVRVILRTSRICLVLIGISKLLGLAITTSSQTSLSPSLDSPNRLNLGLLYLLFGSFLIFRRGQHGSTARRVIAIATFSCLGSCWIARFLSAAGITAIADGFQMQLVPLVVTTAIAVLLFLPQRRSPIPGAVPKVDMEVALVESLFPFAIAIPIALAVLRYHAESRKLVHPDLALLLHVVLSAGSMIAMILYSEARIQAVRRQSDAIDEVEANLHAQYREVFASLSAPVWIFCAEGRLTYANGPALELDSPDTVLAQNDLSRTDYPFGINQQPAIFSAALLGRPLDSVTALRNPSQSPVLLPVECLKLIQTYRGTPGKIILVTRNSAAPSPACHAVFGSPGDNSS